VSQNSTKKSFKTFGEYRNLLKTIQILASSQPSVVSNQLNALSSTSWSDCKFAIHLQLLRTKFRKDTLPGTEQARKKYERKLAIPAHHSCRPVRCHRLKCRREYSWQNTSFRWRPCPEWYYDTWPLLRTPLCHVKAKSHSPDQSSSRWSPACNNRACK